MKACTKCKEMKELTKFYKNGKDSWCKECSKKQNALYQRPNKDAPHGQKSSPERKAIQARSRAKNRDRIKEQRKKSDTKNKHKVLARTRKYQLAKVKATPKWLTKEMWAEIENIYLEAALLITQTGIAHEVDHIVPINGREVKGLHVPWNLQIISMTDNRRKFNKY
jgi:5-methylcytosine-specific restriction endonuclease McrA